MRHQAVRNIESEFVVQPIEENFALIRLRYCVVSLEEFSMSHCDTVHVAASDA
jgi:hypothetical protein